MQGFVMTRYRKHRLGVMPYLAGFTGARKPLISSFPDGKNRRGSMPESSLTEDAEITPDGNVSIASAPAAIGVESVVFRAGRPGNFPFLIRRAQARRTWVAAGTRLVLYLFGTPGQDRFWFMWDDLSFGALGAVVLADTRRLGDCFPSVDYFERRQLPFIVAINVFDGAPRHNAEDVRIALDLDPNVPAMLCDARQRDSVKDVLITLVQHVLAAGPVNGRRAPGTDAVGQPGTVG